MTKFLKINWSDSLRKLGFKHKIINLSQEVKEYILEDGIFINEAWRGQPDQSEGICKRFPSLEELINNIISEYEGKVFVKLNWWSPKDCRNWLPDLQC